MAVTWRQIERALIEIAQEHQFHIEQTRGESFVTIDMQFSLETLAKELAERLK